QAATEKAAFELEQVQLWKTSDGKTFSKKADAKKHQDAIDNIVTAGGVLGDALAKALAAAEGEEPVEAAVVDIAALGVEVAKWSATLKEAERAFEPHLVNKGLY